MSWYPGKLIAEKVNPSSATSSSSTTAANEAAEAKKLAEEEQEALKKEKGIRSMLEKGRQKFIEKRLVGSISYSYRFAAFTDTVSCTISDDDAPDTEVEFSEEEKKSSSAYESMALPAIDIALRKLSFRAKGWKTSKLVNNLELTDTIELTIPFFGLASLSISIAVTVASLLAHLQREEEGKGSS